MKGTLSSILLVDIPYSRKYWRSLNLAVWSRAAEIKILADFNLAVVARTAKFSGYTVYQQAKLRIIKVMYKINVEPNSTDMLRKESH